MRFGNWREAAIGLCAMIGLGTGLTASVQADGWHLHPTLPGEVPAYDFNTGGPYYAPPIPYGHYAKDPAGHMAKSVGLLKGSLMGLGSHFGDKLHGHGCGKDGCGHGGGCGHGDGGCLGSHAGLGHGGGSGCGFCSGLGLFKHGAKSGCGFGHDGCDGGSGCGALAAGPGLGGHHKKSFAPYHPAVVATSQGTPSGQAVVLPTSQGACGQSGCGLGALHSHLGNLKNKLRCRLCGGNGCGPCGGAGFGDPCGGCGGNGHGLKGLCGSCGGCGLFSGLHHGKGNGNGCPSCGGAGCKHCLKGLGSKLHGLVKSPMGMLHRPKFDWFVGPGGPVPLTPGYVPYIVTTRSPRDYFAFPPMTPDAQ
jgi:hypothetical protein